MSFQSQSSWHQEPEGSLRYASVRLSPVKETGKATLRQVRVQGKLRIVAEYETPGDTSCLSPPPIFSGEHDVYTIELEPPPEIFGTVRTWNCNLQYDFTKSSPIQNVGHENVLPFSFTQ